KKVVLNLIKGLEKIGYPYVVNAKLDTCQRLWIHDDVSALKKINSLSDDIKALVGPNLFINPENISTDIDLSKVIYIHPSDNVKKVWQKRGYNKSPIEVWPVGVDTEEFKPTETPKQHVLIYFKNREDKELKNVEEILKNKKIDYKIIRYGKYKEKEYKEALSKSKYIIWIGCPESQGLALEEALSMNIPALVIDSGKIEYGVELTSAPYFDERCGIKINDFGEFERALTLMESKYSYFKPREYISENLNLEKQARDFINLYETHFGLTFSSGMTEKVTPKGSWRNGRLYYRFWYRMKECLKDFAAFFGKD
ncbi:MAG: hypothetical protein WC629_02800, partial [Candidatus Paceibacterota bacterium]